MISILLRVSTAYLVCCLTSMSTNNWQLYYKVEAVDGEKENTILIKKATVFL